MNSFQNEGTDIYTYTHTYIYIHTHIDIYINNWRQIRFPFTGNEIRQL